MKKTFLYEGQFLLESGAKINDLTLTYHTFGELNAEKDNIIWVFHAISANSDVLQWWPGIVGKDCLYDPSEYFIVCANALGSPYGSTKPENLSFPNYTVRDVSKAIIALSDYLQISRIHTVIGGSFGGYQALEFAYSYGGRIDHMILLASSAQESAWGIAIHESQRIALQIDPTFGQSGGGEAGMKAARSIAMLTYRTSKAFEDKQSDHPDKLDDFKASSYIQYQGDKFVRRFDALSYFYLTKCIDSHNIGRHRGGVQLALNSISIPTLIIGFSTDELVPFRAQELLADHIENSEIVKIDSEFGHDGFLIEVEKIRQSIKNFYQKVGSTKSSTRRVIIKFGGSSLYPNENLIRAADIIELTSQKESLVIVLSALEGLTNMLEDLYNTASAGLEWESKFQAVLSYLQLAQYDCTYDDILEQLHSVVSSVEILRSNCESSKALVLSFGGLISSRILGSQLVQRGLNSHEIDGRQLLFTVGTEKNLEILHEKSRSAAEELIHGLPEKTIAIIPGFIALDETGRTVTLGRDGSNYTAALLADYLDALRFENYTKVAGIFTGDPRFVDNPKFIDRMTYKEAHELANFGLHLLHPKTITPLISKEIPLLIKSLYEPFNQGTLIDRHGGRKGIKAVSCIEDVALVQLEGIDFANKVGIDGRIFKALSKVGVSVRMISQASSERGIGFVINQSSVDETVRTLKQEFNVELQKGAITNLMINEDIGIIAIVGRHNYALERAILVLRRHKIWMYLISNSISGEHISLVIDKSKIKKALRLVHEEIFGVIKRLNVFVFGSGGVGQAFIQQVQETKANMTKLRQLDVNIIGIANSRRYTMISQDDQLPTHAKLENAHQYFSVMEIINEIEKLDLEHVVIADLSSSPDFCKNYHLLLNQNYDIVTANKVANSGPLQFYQEIRKIARKNNRKFYYETNVGAGLPIIDTLKNLHQSSDRVTKITGVVSGSLSYIFNRFSVEDCFFSGILLDAQKEGLTESDPRLDLMGLDSARKLIIAAREVGMDVELNEVEVESLLPPKLRSVQSWQKFKNQFEELDNYYSELKKQLEPDEVFRYVAVVDLIQRKLSCNLIKVPRHSNLGMVRNADSYIEIYTSSYGKEPIIIQGAGAGTQVTARGVYTDILRIGREV